MAIFVVVKQDGVVVSKEVYSGDTSMLQAKLDKQSLADPRFSYQLFNDVDEDKFNAVSVPQKPDPLKTQWQTAKGAGTLAAITFLAQRLGLE